MNTMFDERETSPPDRALELLARRILVVIPALNEAAHIEDCLRSLMRGSAALSSVQVIVADGGSTDGTRDIVQELSDTFPNVSLIDNPGRLQAAGVNAGAQLAEYGRDILVRCDAHADYPEDYILNLALKLEETGAASVVVPMDAQGTTCFQRANAWVVDTPLGSGGSAHRGGSTSGYVDHGHHAAFRLEHFLRLGGYDETFSHNEDAEYDARLSQAGGKIYLDADIRVGYYPRTTISGLWRQYFGYGRGRARNLLKNGQRPRLRQLVPVLNLLLLVASLLVAALTPLALAWPVFYVGVLGLVSAWFVVSKKSLCGLWAGPALGAMHLSWGLGFLAGVFASMRARAA
ncbi:MAG: glycosyltransferase family 2 protein [Aquisalinus sp.]|nr:glycosyltransferase family 2 protein [Aquisalinus sp.]